MRICPLKLKDMEEDNGDPDWRCPYELERGQARCKIQRTHEAHGTSGNEYVSVSYHNNLLSGWSQMCQNVARNCQPSMGATNSGDAPPQGHQMLRGRPIPQNRGLVYMLGFLELCGGCRVSRMGHVVKSQPCIWTVQMESTSFWLFKGPSV